MTGIIFGGPWSFQHSTRGVRRHLFHQYPSRSLVHLDSFHGSFLVGGRCLVKKLCQARLLGGIPVNAFMNIDKNQRSEKDGVEEPENCLKTDEPDFPDLY